MSLTVQTVSQCLKMYYTPPELLLCYESHNIDSLLVSKMYYTPPELLLCYESHNADGLRKRSINSPLLFFFYYNSSAMR